MNESAPQGVPTDPNAAKVANGYRYRTGCTMLAIGKCPECGHIHRDMARRAAPQAAPSVAPEPVAWTKRSELEKLKETPPGYARAMWSERTSFIEGREAADVPLYAGLTLPAVVQAPDGSNRSTNTADGWVNELLLLAEHREPIPTFARSAMRTIAHGLRRTLAGR